MAFVTNPIGIIGEEEAAKILERKRLRVIERNWRMGHLEVDLIAEKLYTDDQGRQWGFVSYIHAIRDKWFCLDEPANPDLAGEKRAAVPSGFQAPTMLPTGSQLGVIIGVVCGVAAGTLTAVLILFRRKRR